MRNWIIYSVIAIALFGFGALPYSAKPPFNYTGAEGSTCGQCHGNLNMGGGSIVTSGLPDSVFFPGQQYDFNITLAHPSVRGRWGFSIGARDANNQSVGSFSTTHPNAGPNVDELSHLNAVFETGTTFTYDRLRWTPPVNPTTAQKTVTFYYIGNAANGDRGLTGDFIYSGTKRVTMGEAIPIVSLTSPAQGAVFDAGSTVALNATASDADGSIAKVEFFFLDEANGAHKLGEDITSPYQLTGNDVEPGNYRLMAKATGNTGQVGNSDTLNITVTGCSGSGNISVYGYTNINGISMINLSSSANYPSYPDVITQLGSFEYGPNLLDNYGAKVRGYICPPQTGNYTFYIASDEQSELWLSTDDDPSNIRRIGYVSSRVAFRSWQATSSQRSQPIRLIKGKRYYIESVHKEGTGADHLSVSWLLPNGVFEAPIPGSRLSPFETITGNRTDNFAARMDKVNKLNDLAGPLNIGIISAVPGNDAKLMARSKLQQPIDIIITDVLGRVMERRPGMAANSIVTIATSLPAGVYFVQARQGQHQQIVKMIRR